MYLAHFGLTEAPFVITPDTRFLFLSERHRDALAHLLYGIGEGGGFVQLTGEVGTGKTTLCRRFLEQVPPHVDVALILNPRLTGPELLAAICDELHVPCPAPASVKHLVDALYRHLLGAHARGRRTALVIDEAQDLAPEVLEDVRLLTNLETAREKLLQIILIGQPELLRLLERDDLRQVAQRITARYHLVPFSRRETCAYIRHRLAIAGVKRLILDAAAMREVHRVSGGVPRLINIVCDRALLGAYAGERHEVDRGIVRRAAREALGGAGPRRRVRPWLWGSAAAAAVAIVAGAWVTAWPERLPWPSALARLTGSPPAAGAPESSASASAPDPSGVPGASAEAGRPSGGVTGSAMSLAEALADPSLASDRRSAFASLYTQWGATYDETRRDGCEGAPPDGLRCLLRTGSWDRLRRFDVPAILELRTPQGTRVYATLVALGDEEATLAFGPERLAFPLAEIDARWDGSFLLVWKAPALSRSILAPGARGRDVLWLRQRLDEAAGRAHRTGGHDVYDAELEQQVAAFQRSRSLLVDGVAGEETLVRLTSAVAGSRAPRLAAGAGLAPLRARDPSAALAAEQR